MSVTTDEIQVQDIAYHRNGIAGEGFYVVTFQWRNDGGQVCGMVGILFPDDDGDFKPNSRMNPRTAVLDRDETARGNIAFAFGNSWRGDTFDTALREAIAKHEI